MSYGIKTVCSFCFSDISDLSAISPSSYLYNSIKIIIKPNKFLTSYLLMLHNNLFVISIICQDGIYFIKLIGSSQPMWSHHYSECLCMTAITVTTIQISRLVSNSSRYLGLLDIQLHELTSQHWRQLTTNLKIPSKRNKF